MLSLPKRFGYSQSMLVGLHRASALASLAGFLAVVALGCHTIRPTPDHEYEVYDGDDLILTFVAAPGPLYSTAPPPPGNWSPPQHPYLTGHAHSATHESNLRELLYGAATIDDFFEALRDEGYRIEEASSP